MQWRTQFGKRRRKDKKTTFYNEKSAFYRSVRYYASKLQDPHAEGELWGFLWLTMQKYPDKSKQYYNVCLRNRCNTLLREEIKHAHLKIEEIEKQAEDEKNGFFDLLRGLSRQQREILILHYYCGYTVEEISRFKGVSRQAVNQTKRRAFKKILTTKKACDRMNSLRS